MKSHLITFASIFRDRPSCMHSEFFTILFCRSTKAIRGCGNWGVADATDTGRQRREGVESEADNERGSEVFQSSVSLWRGLYYLLDPLWKEAHLLLPWHQICLWPWLLLRPWGIIVLFLSSSQSFLLFLLTYCLKFEEPKGSFWFRRSGVWRTEIQFINAFRRSTCFNLCMMFTVLNFFFTQVSVLEMDGQFDRLDELIYVESHLSNISTKFYGEVTQQMLKHGDFPGSNNGTGLFQTIVGLKIRDLYEQLTAAKASTPLEATKA